MVLGGKELDLSQAEDASAIAVAQKHMTGDGMSTVDSVTEAAHAVSAHRRLAKFADVAKASSIEDGASAGAAPTITPRGGFGSLATAVIPELPYPTPPYRGDP